jgi:hypothetical protein
LTTAGSVSEFRVQSAAETETDEIYFNVVLVQCYINFFFYRRKFDSQNFINIWPLNTKR